MGSSDGAAGTGGARDPARGDVANRLLRPHPALQIRSRFAVDPTDKDRHRLRERAVAILASDPQLEAALTEPMAVRPGLRDAPGLIVHDISHTRPRGSTGPSLLEYRGLLLAGDADEVAIGANRSPAFEAHIRHLFGLGGPRVHRIEQALAGNLAAAARRDELLLERSARRARDAGAFVVHPYSSTPGIWALAGEIADRAGVPVVVAGPPPALAARVNDKIWFARQVKAILGPGSTPPTATATDVYALIERLRDLGAPGDNVAVRLRSSAAGEGNLVIPKSAVTGSRPAALVAMLERLFGVLSWEEIFPLQLAVWEAPVLASPSVQTWIPAVAGGPPIVEGVMMQEFDEERGGFSGATPSTLPPAWQQDLARQAALLAGLFQELGYFGRCSFDAILVDDDPDHPTIHWVECNGRWGGASIPMTAAERLVGDWRSRPFQVVSVQRRLEAPLPADKALEILGEWVLQPGGREGVLLLSPTALELARGADLMAIAGDRDRAAGLAAEARARLLGP